VVKWPSVGIVLLPRAGQWCVDDGFCAQQHLDTRWTDFFCVFEMAAFSVSCFVFVTSLQQRVLFIKVNGPLLWGVPIGAYGDASPFSLSDEAGTVWRRGGNAAVVFCFYGGAGQGGTRPDRMARCNKTADGRNPATFTLEGNTPLLTLS